ncbi:MAG: hypothetical protein K0U93_23100 [Gammaproteobacteria bacterium]|nr:hypothetical protein [Gammaproteobacteria bacterium]
MREMLQARIAQLQALKTLVVASILSLVIAPSAFAIVAPAAGSFAFDLYDVAVNDVLLGAPGFVGAVIIMVVSAVNLTRNWVLSIAGLLGGVILINADAITASMGMLV